MFKDNVALYENNKKALDTLLDALPADAGREYLFSLIRGDTKEVKAEAAQTIEEEKKKEPIQKPKENISSVIPPQPVKPTSSPILPIEAPTPYIVQKKKIASFAPVAQHMKDETKKLGKDMKEMWSGFLDIFRRKKK